MATSPFLHTVCFTAWHWAEQWPKMTLWKNLPTYPFLQQCYFKFHLSLTRDDCLEAFLGKLVEFQGELWNHCPLFSGWHNWKGDRDPEERLVSTQWQWGSFLFDSQCYFEKFRLQKNERTVWDAWARICFLFLSLSLSLSLVFFIALI